MPKNYTTDYSIVYRYCLYNQSYILYIFYSLLTPYILLNYNSFIIYIIVSIIANALGFTITNYISYLSIYNIIYIYYNSQKLSLYIDNYYKGYSLLLGQVIRIPYYIE